MDTLLLDERVRLGRIVAAVRYRLGFAGDFVSRTERIRNCCVGLVSKLSPIYKYLRKYLQGDFARTARR